MERINWNQPSTSVPFFDPKALSRMKVDTYNRREGDLKGYDCPDCRNKGSIAYLREDGSMYTKECDCLSLRRQLHRQAESGLKHLMEKMTFGSYQVTHPWQRELREKVLAFSREPEGWLLLCGQSGCGKTHLCTALCAALVEKGMDVVYMPWRNQAARLKALSMEEGREEALRSFTQAPVLYIDDLYKAGRDREGRADPTAADVNLAYEIINQRYNSGLCTIVSTEKNTQELTQIDEATAGRIFERAGENVFCVDPDRRKNYRMRNIKM